MEQVPRRTGFSPAVPSRKGLRHPAYTGVPPGCPRGCNEDKSLAYLINSQRSPAQPAPFHLSRGPRRHVLSSLPFLRASVFELGSWIESRASFCPGQPTTSNVLSPLLILSLSRVPSTIVVATRYVHLTTPLFPFPSTVSFLSFHPTNLGQSSYVNVKASIVEPISNDNSGKRERERKAKSVRVDKCCSRLEKKARDRATIACETVIRGKGRRRRGRRGRLQFSTSSFSISVENSTG